MEIKAQISFPSEKDFLTFWEEGIELFQKTKISIKPDKSGQQIVNDLSEPVDPEEAMSED